MNCAIILVPPYHEDKCNPAALQLALGGGFTIASQRPIGKTERYWILMPQQLGSLFPNNQVDRNSYIFGV